MDRLFARFWDGEVAGRPISGEWTPPTDITPGDDAWYVHVALPGVDSKDVHVDVMGNTLKITGERRWMQDNREPAASEIEYGQFARTLTLPATVDAERVQATYHNGLLELTLPLADSAKPRRIELNGTTVAKKRLAS
jgi:HSP20 family protein